MFDRTAFDHNPLGSYDRMARKLIVWDTILLYPKNNTIFSRTTCRFIKKKKYIKEGLPIYTTPTKMKTKSSH